MRKSKPSTATRGNVSKADSYREAYSRIKSAMNEHYYVEAMALMESVIADRILSYLVGACGLSPLTEKGRPWAFGYLINKAKEKSPLDDASGNCVWTRVNKWREDRNRIVHGFVSSIPGTPTAPVDEFLEKAKIACEEGHKLSREVTNWNKREKTKWKKRSDNT